MANSAAPYTTQIIFWLILPLWRFIYQNNHYLLKSNIFFSLVGLVHFSSLFPFYCKSNKKKTEYDSIVMPNLVSLCLWCVASSHLLDPLNWRSLPSEMYSSIFVHIIFTTDLILLCYPVPQSEVTLPLALLSLWNIFAVYAFSSFSFSSFMNFFL